MARAFSFISNSKPKKSSDKAKGQYVAVATVWDSGLVVHRGPECPYLRRQLPGMVLVPLTLLLLARRTRSFATEYLLYAKGPRRDGDMLIVEDDYCVPEQRATAASVENHSSCPTEYSVAIHKHPSGLRQFSETDWRNINLNNELSLLFADGAITDATVRVKLPCGSYMVTRVSADLIVYYVPSSIDEARKKAEELEKELRNKVGSYSYYDTKSYGYYSISGKSL